MTRRLPPVSVVIPTRNRRATVLSAVRSALAQDGVDVEVVVVDEASDDGTAEALLELRDERLHLVRHDVALGAAAARDHGVAVARHGLLAFLDDDDVWAPTRLATVLVAMDDRGSRWGFTATVEVDDELAVVGLRRVPAGDLRRALLNANVVPGGGSALVVRRELLRRAGGWSCPFPTHEDWVLAVRLADLDLPAMVDRPLVGYRVWAGSMSADLERMEAGYRAIAEWLAPRRAAAGVPADSGDLDRYLASYALEGGRRRAAASRYLGMARRRRAPVDAARAAAVAVAPAVSRRIAARRRAGAVPPAWRAEAEAWLAPLRGEVAA